jgi:hypothetical protein
MKAKNIHVDGGKNSDRKDHKRFRIRNKPPTIGISFLSPRTTALYLYFA